MVFTSALAACGSDPAEDGAVATGGTAHHRGGEGGGDGGVSSGGVPPTGGADSVSSGGVSSTGGAPFGQGGDAPETSCSSGTFDHDEDTKTPCVAYRSCHAGQFVVVDATETTDRECQACAEGEFSTSMNAANCQPWRACSWSRGGVALPGSATTNVKCGVVSDYRQFGTAYADAARQVAVAEDGSVYVVGQRGDSEPANVDGFLRKYDSSGVEIWTRWTEAEDVFDVGIDASGNVYVAGTRLSESNRTGFIRRYDADGSLAWSDDLGQGQSRRVRFDPQGAVYLLGEVDGPLGQLVAQGGKDVFLRKYTTTGSVVWTRQIGTSADDYQGGVSCDSNGDIHLGLNPISQFGTPYGLLIRLNAIGNIVAYVGVGGEAAPGQFYVGAGMTDVVFDPQGSIYVVGSTLIDLDGMAGTEDGYVMKFNRQLERVWVRQFGAWGERTAAEKLVLSSGGQPLVVAHGDEDAYVRIFTADGITSQTLTVASEAQDLVHGLAFDGEAVYVAGETLGAFVGTNSGEWDAFVGRLPLPIGP